MLRGGQACSRAPHTHSALRMSFSMRPKNHWLFPPVVIATPSAGHDAVTLAFINSPLGLHCPECRSGEEKITWTNRLTLKMVQAGSAYLMWLNKLITKQHELGCRKSDTFVTRSYLYHHAWALGEFCVLTCLLGWYLLATPSLRITSIKFGSPQLR